MTPSVTIHTNSLAPTSWKDSQLQDEKKIRRERIKRDKSHFQLLYLARYSEAIKPDFFSWSLRSWLQYHMNLLLRSLAISLLFLSLSIVRWARVLKKFSAWTKVPSVTKGSSHAAMVARVSKGKDYRTLRSGPSLSQFFFLFACVPSKKKLSAPTLLIYFAKECSEGCWKSKFWTLCPLTHNHIPFCRHNMLEHFHFVSLFLSQD
jgi:hypothetical protein